MPEEPTGMEAAIAEIEAQVTAANLWGAVAAVASIIGVVLLFVLGLTFVRRVTKGASKGKLKF